MNKLTNTLKTLITKHTIGIIQQEQRLKAMLADLLPHDKQMRFLLELSLRAQIPHKLVAIQNETRVDWEANIKSLKHYFKDEYFLEDKAVESVFDCWVEVLPRIRQKSVVPKLGNLGSDTKLKDCTPRSGLFRVGVIDKLIEYLVENKINNYKTLISDIRIIQNYNHSHSFPKLILPLSLKNKAKRKAPSELPERLFYFQRLIKYTKEDSETIYRLSNEKRYKELNDYCEKRGINDFNSREKKQKEAYEAREQEINSIKSINADRTKTFCVEEFRELGVGIGLDLISPIKPSAPTIPHLHPVIKTYKKKVTRISHSCFLFLLSVVVMLTFYFLSDYYIARMILGIPLIVAGFLSIGSVLSGVFFEKEFWVEKVDVELKYRANEISKMEQEADESYRENLFIYNKKLKSYNEQLSLYENTIKKQTNDFNDAFPLITRQMWLTSTIPNTYEITNGTQNKTAKSSVFITKLTSLYPKWIKANADVFLVRTDIILNLENKSCINIEIDEPYDIETHKETHFIGSNDEDRDLLFAQNNWYVLRFSESQVTYAMSECIAIVQELVTFAQTANTQHLLNIREMSKNIEVLCWSKEEASQMAMDD